MKSEDYHPLWVESVVEITNRDYILYGYPESYNEDFYFKINIQSDDDLTRLNDHEGEYIHIDLVSSNELYINSGQFAGDSSTDGPIRYINYSYQEIEKTSREEWKPKLKDLHIRFTNLLKEKLPLYQSTSERIINRYQSIYKSHIESGNTFGLTETEMLETRIFLELYNYFSYHGHESCLFQLVTKEKKTQFSKDWRVDFLALQVKFDDLLKVDLEDYNLIKDHIIGIYKFSFHSRLHSLKYSYRYMDENKYRSLFNSIIETVNQIIN